MRVAVIGKKNHLYWDYHVKMALEELGHEVFHFQINERPFLINVVRNVAKPFGKKGVSDVIFALQLKKKLQEFKPHFVFITHAFFIPLIYYEVIKDLHFPLYAWDGDGGANCKAMQKYKEYIDVLFESELRYVQENKLDFKQIEYLPFCANPKIFKPMNFVRKNYIFFAGASTPRREKIIKQIHYPMKIRGWGWNEIQDLEFDIKNKKLDMQDLVIEYNKAFAALNIHQEVNHIDALNMRTFEVPACKTLLVCDYRRELELLFDLDKELVVYTYDKIEESIEKLRNKDFVKSVTEKGYKRVISSHTYIHRMQKVLKYL